MPTIDDSLWQEGNQSVSWNATPPVTVEGTFVRQEEGVQTDIKTREVKLTKAGAPMRKVVVTIADKEGELWDLHVKMRSALYRAIKAAIILQGVPGLRPGDYLTITYTGDADPTSPGLTGAKQYTVALDPGRGVVPATTEGDDDF